MQYTSKFSGEEIDSILDSVASKQDAIPDLETIRSNSKNASDTIARMVESGYLFAGIATIDTNPGIPDAKVFYIANGKGTYTNFGGLEVTEYEVVVLYWDTAWHKVSTGIASQAKLSELEEKVNGYSPDITIVPNEYVDNQGGFVAYNGWSRSEYISCDGLTKLQYKNTGIRATYNSWYDENKVFIETFVLQVTDNGEINIPATAKYFAISTKSENINDLSFLNLPKTEGLAERVETMASELEHKQNTLIAGEGIKIDNDIISIDNGYVESDMFKAYEWHTGSYYDTPSTDQLTRKYIVVPCENGNIFNLVFGSANWGLYVYYADTNGVIDYENKNIDSVITIGERTNGRIPTEIRVTTFNRNAPSVNITDESWKTFDVQCINASIINSKGSLYKIRVAEWNFGDFHNGSGGVGIPDDEVATKLPLVKNLLIDMGADILLATEYSTNVDMSGTMNTYNTLLKQFYPYKVFNPSSQMAILSKYPFVVSVFTSPDNRTYLIGYIVIGGEKVGLGLIHPRSADGEEAVVARIADHQFVIEKLANYNKVIIGGDMNNFQDSEMDIYPQNGYVLGNLGYFGAIDTYIENPSREWHIDNIITKGFNIDNFAKCDSRAEVSDHYPVYADIAVYM